MKNFVFLISLLFVLMLSGCGKSEKNGEKIPENEGKINGVCYPNKTCDKGLACDEENNICINAENTPQETDDSENTESDDDYTETTDKETTDENSMPDEDSYTKLPECSPTSGTPCIDSSIGYIWSSKSKDPKSQYNAGEYCGMISEGGYTDWRVPTISELRTLVQHCPTMETGGACEVTDLCTGISCWEETCTHNYCPSEWEGKYSKLGDTDSLWSSTSKGGAWDYFWFMEFEDPFPSWAHVNYNEIKVRCIRSDWNPCLPNQCKYVKNSTGQCVVLDKESYYCQCYSDYIWHVSANVCEPKEDYVRVADCTGLPENAEWNTVSKIEQVLDGSEWKPSTEGVYNENGSQTKCRFKCKYGYFWNGSECRLPECSPTSKTPCIDSTTGYIWSRIIDSDAWLVTAEYLCDNATEGGFDGWRVPNVDELRTLIQNCDATVFGGECRVSESCLEISCSDETCNGCAENSEGGYSKFGDTGLLSSQSVTENPAYESGTGIWVVNFSNGEINNGDSQLKYSFRCVK